MRTENLLIALLVLTAMSSVQAVVRNSETICTIRLVAKLHVATCCSIHLTSETLRAHGT